MLLEYGRDCRILSRCLSFRQIGESEIFGVRILGEGQF